MPVPMSFSEHISQDFLFYLAFLGGQLLFVLKRAASAIRSKTNPVSSRMAYIYANWDVLLIRVVLEAVFYVGYRHYDQANHVLSLFTTWRVPDWLPQVPFALFLLGYVVDSQIDKYSLNPKAPEWLKENIPNVQVLSSHTIQTGTDSSGTGIVVEKTVTVEKTQPVVDKDKDKP